MQLSSFMFEYWQQLINELQTLCKKIKLLSENKSFISSFSFNTFFYEQTRHACNQFILGLIHFITSESDTRWNKSIKAYFLNKLLRAGYKRQKKHDKNGLINVSMGSKITHHNANL